MRYSSDRSVPRGTPDSGSAWNKAEAVRLRFRPILMTAISSICGFFPLLVASGAGSPSRQALGTAIVGGLAVATVLGVLFVPVLYVVVQWVSELRSQDRGPSSP